MSRSGEWAESCGRCVAIHERLYPAALRHLHDPPAELWVRGAQTDFSGRSVAIAIVGARDASADGLALAAALGRGLASRGVTVVSGLARGIDAAAHQGALAGGGDTVAVLGCGIDQCYPRKNAELHAEILARGCVISEFAPGTPPLPGNFPRRNRIISGLCLGVVVVEATERSGSLVTARHALEQGREVFAVPGRAGAPRSRGPHSLLKRGAKLVETVDDVLEEFPEIAARLPKTSPSGGSVPGVVGALLERPDTVDGIARRLGRQVPEILGDLLDLELRGEVRRGPGGRFLAGARFDAGSGRGGEPRG